MTAAAQLLDKAVGMLKPGDKLALCSDAHAYRGKVLLAVARPEAACVLAIAAAEYSGMQVLSMAGMSA